MSGALIGQRLGVSRAAVWKMIVKLKEKGYHIDALTNKGYKLIQPIDIVNESEIKFGLKTKKIGHSVYFYNETSSTNDAAAKLAREGCADGAVIVAESQNGGKGRRGKVWTSPAKSGIWMSIVLRPELPPFEASRLTLAAGLSVCRAIRELTGLPSVIKWPNDVMIHERKICGILTEMNAEMDKINYIIVGIGINVNIDVFPEEMTNMATSLKIEGRQSYSRIAILQRVLLEFEKVYEDYLFNDDQGSFLEEYKKFCITLNQNVNVIAKEPFTGIAVDINQNGELIVKRENGEETAVFSGEVSIRPIHDAEGE